MNAKETSKIIKLSKQKLGNNIAIFKAKKSTTNFGLEIEQLEYKRWATKYIIYCRLLAHLRKSKRTFYL
ncbi:MAG: hypothetical protein ACJA2M_001139 [Polaribacter sp.]|jgi:hypothetical protein